MFQNIHLFHKRTEILKSFFIWIHFHIYFRKLGRNKKLSKMFLIKIVFINNGISKLFYTIEIFDLLSRMFLLIRTKKKINKKNDWHSWIYKGWYTKLLWYHFLLFYETKKLVKFEQQIEYVSWLSTILNTVTRHYSSS